MALNIIYILIASRKESIQAISNSTLYLYYYQLRMTSKYLKINIYFTELGECSRLANKMKIRYRQTFIIKKLF